MEMLSAIGTAVGLVVVGGLFALIAVVIAVYDSLSKMDDLNDE